MEGLDLKQMAAMVDIIAEEKGLPKETVIGVIEQAIAAAWRKDAGEREMNVRAVLNTNTGEADVYIAREVIEDGVGYIPATEIPLSEAGEGAKLGDIVEEKVPVKEFGRVGAMTAKQVVIQRLREAENEAVLSEFADKIGTIVTALVTKVEPRIVRLDLGRTVGIMPRSEQIDGEYYTVGSQIKVLVKKIERGDKGTQLIMSRGSAEFVQELFRQEVPEIENGTVEIKGIAREAGRRTKIAVTSTINGVDPVGTFVGGRGVRVQTVMNEIGDREKIDIITWSDNPSEYIREALSPAEIMKVEIDGKKAKIYVSEEQQSIAIGKQGQNVRLASKLTGYDLDIVLSGKPAKKKKQNVEDSLLSALEESEEEDVVTEANEEALDGSAEAVEALEEREMAETEESASDDSKATEKTDVAEKTEATESSEAAETPKTADNSETETTKKSEEATESTEASEKTTESAEATESEA